MALIRNCVFHYEMEFIHPFMDGNGRIGRLWQTIILMEEYPVFGFLPFESFISRDSSAYYKALTQIDNVGYSTPFIEYMLGILDESLAGLLSYKSRVLTDNDRIQYFAQINKLAFTRKNYMDVFKELSSAIASRDLRKGIELGIWEKEGDKKNTIYKIVSK